MSHLESDIADGIAGCDSQNRPLASPIRTDGRTNEEVGPVADILALPNARERAKRLESLDIRGERWPLVRTGEREPIRWAVRLAVKFRDEFTCKFCGAEGLETDMEIDHIVPWSTGGSDRSVNLRTLCKACNQRRSNLNDGTHHIRVLPVTWWCIECWLDGMTHEEHWATRDPDVFCSVNTCAYNAPAFGAVPRVRFEAADQLAYCAHCRHNAYTEVTL